MDISTFKKIRNILFVVILIAMACGAMEFGVAVIFIGVGGLVLFSIFISPIYAWIKDKIEDKQMLNDIKKDIEKKKTTEAHSTGCNRKIVIDSSKTNIRTQEELCKDIHIAELEMTMKRVAANGRKIDNTTVGDVIDGLILSPLIICTDNVENVRQGKPAHIMTLCINDIDVIPLFTRKEYCKTELRGYGFTYVEPEKMLLLLAAFGKHIIINPDSENRLILNYELFMNVIIAEYSKRLEAKIAMKKYQRDQFSETKELSEVNDKLAWLVCNYLMENEKGERMTKILNILSFLQNTTVWVPCSAKYSDRDVQKFLSAKKGDVITTEDEMRMKPDILKNEAGNLYFPVFSTKDEAPESYAKNFSWMNMSFVQCCNLVKSHAETDEIIINAYSNSLVIKKELIDIVLKQSQTQNIDSDKKMLVNEKILVSKSELEKAHKDTNGGRKISLDDRGVYFLRVFCDEMKVTKYIIDVEDARDTHFELQPQEAYKLNVVLSKAFFKENLSDNLKAFFISGSDFRLYKVMNEHKIKFKQF